MLLTAGGCRSIVVKLPQRLDTPTATVAGLRVVERTSVGCRVELTLELANPNAVSLPLERTQYTIAIAGGLAVTLEDHANCTVPAKGRQTVTLPASFADEGTSVQGASFKVQGLVQYKPPGEWRTILTESGVPLPSSRFQGAGVVE